MLFVAIILAFPVTSYMTQGSRDFCSEINVEKKYSHIRCKQFVLISATVQTLQQCKYAGVIHPSLVACVRPLNSLVDLRVNNHNFLIALFYLICVMSSVVKVLMNE